MKIVDFPGTVAVVQHREWSDEYRMIFKTESPSLKPPTPEGKRQTAYLSAHGARQLVSSCEFMAMKRGGYTTFLTLTFDNEARIRIRNCGSIQQETKRFFDGLQKMYQRGLVIKTDLFKKRIEGHKDKLDYLWVAENPLVIDKETGECWDNPHVHVLLRWEVPYEDFKYWAERIERLWGQGFAHLEKMKCKSRESAAGYLMKALEYLKKSAGGSDQGAISGNRYGISECARAPGWELIGSYAWHVAGALIERARMAQRRRMRPLEQKRDKLKEYQDASNDGQAKNKLSNALKKVRLEISNTKGEIYYGRNHVICSGKGAFNRFMSWLDRWGWVGLKKPLSLYAEILRKKAVKAQAEYDKWHKNVLPDEWWDSLVFDDDLVPSHI